MRRRWWALIALVVLAVAGCTNVTSGAPSGSPSTPTPVDPGSIPEDELVWSVYEGPGMMAPQKWDPDLPDIAIYGDGTAYIATSGKDSVTVEKGAVDPDALHDLLADAAGSGLFDDTDFGDPNITDMGSTTVSTYYDGELHNASAYALGESQGLTGKQKKARQQLIELMDSAEGAVSDLTAYDQPDRVEVYVVDDPDWDGQDGVEWTGPPLEPVLTESDQTCGEISGGDAAAAYAAFEDSYEGEFTVNGVPTKLQVNILLPGVPACDD